MNGSGDDDLGLPDFTGKVVTFYAAGLPAGMDAGVTLEFAEFRRLGGRLFVVGRIPESVAGDWASRLQSGVAWDSVVHYVVFDSREDLSRRLATVRPGLLARIFGRTG